MSSISCVTDRDQTETRALTLGPPQCAIRLWMKNRTEYCMTINRISKCFFEISRLGYTEICKLLYKAVIPGCRSTVIGVFGEEYCASNHICTSTTNSMSGSWPWCKAFTFGDFKKRVAPFMVPLSPYSEWRSNILPSAVQQALSVSWNPRNTLFHCGSLVRVRVESSWRSGGFVKISSGVGRRRWGRFRKVGLGVSSASFLNYDQTRNL